MSARPSPRRRGIQPVEDQNGSSNWLHNMSAAPAVTIRYSPRRQGLVVPLAELPHFESDGSQAWKQLCALCGLQTRRRGFREFAERAALEHPLIPALPPMIPVALTLGGEPHPRLSHDPLLTLSIALRVTGTIYVQRAVPFLDLSRLPRTLSLILPRDWKLP